MTSKIYRLNRESFELVPAEGMPSNVVVGVNKDWQHRNPDSKPTLELHHAVSGIIRNCATINSSWTFEGLFGYYNPSLLTEFKVFSGDEYVGTIDYNVRKSRYEISSPKIQKSMERKSYRATTKLDLALKLIDSFSTKSLAEKLEEAKASVEGGIRRATRNATSTYREAAENSHGIILDFALNNWQAVVNSVSNDTTLLTKLDKLQEAIHERNVTQSIYHSEGKCVYIKGDVYVVGKLEEEAGGERHTVYSSSDTLPSGIRRAIGLLKLVEKDSVLDGVGYKYEDDKFLVLSKYIEMHST
jgi:hypothetical protein